MSKLNSAARKFQAQRSLSNGGKARSTLSQTKSKKKARIYSSPALSPHFCNSVFLLMTSLVAQGVSVTDFPRLFFAVGNNSTYANSTYAIGTRNMEDNVDWVQALLTQGICNASLVAASQVGAEIKQICLEAASGEGGPLMTISAANTTLAVVTNGLQCVLDTLNGQCISDFRHEEKKVLIPIIAALLLCCCCLGVCSAIEKRNRSPEDEARASLMTVTRRA